MSWSLTHGASINNMHGLGHCQHPVSSLLRIVSNECRVVNDGNGTVILYTKGGFCKKPHPRTVEHFNSHGHDAP